MEAPNVDVIGEKYINFKMQKFLEAPPLLLTLSTFLRKQNWLKTFGVCCCKQSAKVFIMHIQQPDA